MRTDPITKETFEPNNPNHYFSSYTSFLTFIDAQDPMEEFVTEKRTIQWRPVERIDPNTGETFMATHPAQIYAPKEDEQAEEVPVEDKPSE